ncbi:hypothetical protein BAURA63_01014 [Brevibacterium aurantiacum]|uniref:Uncharacterized protein n=2 Tax=Brevibacterium aurantiacum TaxID=273384 RepID=A0A2H1IAK7_BREAU|nr:hypothetical protein CIK58_06415 [Brevibacterium aurantiacum]GEB22858.1 hypothetical protein BAU01nite_15910 [Brevibacterium aurantiacum]SMX72215.1 hypothetical protein BAURA63_01014 [Brevibacterium aurantiacum]SMX93811.1 hypothetical protein BAUR920_02730 [Brevibacterium aurantiacum]
MGRIIMTAEVKRSHNSTNPISRLAKRFTSVNIGQGEKVGYTEDSSEARMQSTALHEGVKLYRHPDGSHEAIDESRSGDTFS